MAETHQIPRKPRYKSSEVCQYTDTQPYVLRFWESEFPQLTPSRSAGGTPVYTREDIDLVLRIKELLYEKQYTIAGAREQLEGEQSGEVTSTEAPRSEERATSTSPEPAPEEASPPAAAVSSSETPHASSPAAPAEAGAKRLFDAVPRERYEDALDEIAHLRLKLQEAENRCRKGEAVQGKAQQEADGYRERFERAVARLTRVRDILKGTGGRA